MLSYDEIKALRDGCEAVERGPWERWGSSVMAKGSNNTLVMCYPNIIADNEPGKDLAAHIARCDPQTIAELCTRVLEAEAKLETVYAVADERLARIKVLEEALRWYGEQTQLAKLIHSEGDSGRNALAKDGGDRARKALEGK